MLQYQAYPIFAHNNTYKQLISQSQYTSYMVCHPDSICHSSLLGYKWRTYMAKCSRSTETNLPIERLHQEVRASTGILHGSDR